MEIEGEGFPVKKEKGSYTIEAVIVMSTIIFIIFAVISAFLLLYQNAVMYYVATQAAQEGAVMWTDTAHDLEGNVSGTDNQGLYYRLGEAIGNDRTNEKTKKIKSWAEKKLKEMTPGTLIGSGAEHVEVTYSGYFVTKILSVKITKEIDIPFEEIARYFGADLDMSVTAKASIAEPAEFVRNVDYGIELGKELWGAISGAIGKLWDSKSK